MLCSDTRDHDRAGDQRRDTELTHAPKYSVVARGHDSRRVRRAGTRRAGPRTGWRTAAAARAVKCRIATEFLIVLVLILANGIFAMSEIAVVAARKVRLQQRADDGDERAKDALALANHPAQFLSTVQVGITLVGILAGVIPINFLAEMTSIGTLVAFIVVSIGVIVLRRSQPDLPRSFKVPFYPLTPILAIVGALWIIQDLRAITIYVFVIWTAVVLLWYFTYGIKHSHLGRHEHVGLLEDEDET